MSVIELGELTQDEELRFAWLAMATAASLWDDVSWDLRFFAIMQDAASAEVILRVHKGFARLFFEEARARGEDASDDSGPGVVEDLS